MLAVELRPEERCRGLQDLVGPAQFLDLTLEVFHPDSLISRESCPKAGVGLCPAYPLTEALVVYLQLCSDGLDRLPLSRVLVLVFQHHPDRSLAELRGVRPARCSFLF